MLGVIKDVTNRIRNGSCVNLFYTEQEPKWPLKNYIHFKFFKKQTRCLSVGIDQFFLNPESHPEHLRISEPEEE